MNKIKKLILRDVRCLQGVREIDIRPLTFLVGENSTGKSTTLGCLQILGDFFRGDVNGIDFNSNPYQMGAFADIVTRPNPKNDSFLLGIEFETEHSQPFACMLSLHESKTGSEPIINKIHYIFHDGIVRVIEGDKNVERPHIELTKKHDINEFLVVCNNYAVHRFHLDLAAFLDQLSLLVDNNKEKTKIKGEEFLLFMRERLGAKDPTRILTSFHSNTHIMRSFGPIRSEPQRTYNSLKETADPGGSEVPMLLRNLKNKNKNEWKKLHKQLVKFGKVSGLFSDIIVRELGPAISDPFQLQIKVKAKDPIVNLVDVGYGVGQILPILVSIFNASRPTMFLLQQPEVHLHPRGQAELSSLLVSMHKNYDHSFLVETHSDYIIDRVRILVRKKKINPEYVSILYFERMKKGNSVKVHDIRMDADGNLTNVPKNYRDFFTMETDTLLGFDDE